MHIRIAAATVPVVLVVWLGIAGYLWQKHDADLKLAAQDTRNLTHAFEENIRRTVEAIDTTIRAARIARAHDPAHFDLAAWERESGLTRELTLQISLADRDGGVIVTNLDKMGGKRVSIADRDHFRTPRDTPGDTLFISRPVLGRVSGRWSVQFVRKMVDAQGAFDGVIVASLDPAFLSRFYASLDIGHGALMLLGQDGVVRSSAPQATVLLGEDLSQTGLMTEVAATPQGTQRLHRLADRVERIYSWRYINQYGLVVVVGLSTADALVGFWQHAQGCAAIGVFVTLLTALVGSVLTRNQRDISLSRRILQAAVENISQGLLVVDKARRVPLINARAVELLQLPSDLSVPGVDFDALLEWQLQAGEFAGENDTTVLKLVESGGVESGTSVYQRKRRNGTVLEVRTKVLETGLVVRTFTDITEQEHTAQVLAAARDAAEAAAHARSEFLAVMSHEIRTPLNGVIGVAGLLEDMELGKAQREYVRLIRQSGDHLLELINDVLDFSRLEAQRVELEEADFDPRALVQGVAEMFLTQANTKGLHLSFFVDDALPAAVRGDPGRLRQILLNLVSNAVKFTDQGWVSVTLAHEPAEADRIRLLFNVADSGIGMAPEASERIFEEFTQMDGSISRRFGGSGLGLAICRRLVEMMGGGIAVDSAPGFGSTFRFDVCLKVADAAAASGPLQPASQVAQAALHVLLAEDNPTNRLVAIHMLERMGHQADAVGNGAEAIAALALKPYDLILMDVMMPEMDGLTATRYIRAAERDGNRITIVGLTAGSSAESLTECLDAGMDAVTTKPVTLERLRAAIAEGNRSVSKQSNVTPPRMTTPRLRELTDMLGEAAVADILQSFTEDSQSQLAAMQQAAEREDTKAVYQLAHSVAGAARNVGADQLAEQASVLEARVGSLSPVQIDAAIEAMRLELNCVLAGLATLPVEAPA